MPNKNARQTNRRAFSQLQAFAVRGKVVTGIRRIHHQRRNSHQTTPPGDRHAVQPATSLAVAEVDIATYTAVLQPVMPTSITAAPGLIQSP